MTDSGLKAQLRTDLTSAMKQRDELRSATLRMVLAALTNEEVAGKQSRELTDADVIAVLTREAKKRREAEQAYADAERPELADRERAEQQVIDGYLPSQMADGELQQLVADAITEAGASSPRDMGAVMKVVQPRIAGRADGGRVAAAVRRQLTG